MAFFKKEKKGRWGWGWWGEVGGTTNAIFKNIEFFRGRSKVIVAVVAVVVVAAAVVEVEVAAVVVEVEVAAVVVESGE